MVPLKSSTLKWRKNEFLSHADHISRVQAACGQQPPLDSADVERSYHPRKFCWTKGVTGAAVRVFLVTALLAFLTPDLDPP